MLLEFEVENYKSFQHRALFSMVPAPKQHGLDYSVFQEKVKRKNVKSLCSSVIYGPNASGKTNIIGAMDTLRAIILRGNIRNAAYHLELIPNNRCKEVCPVLFKISFLEDGLKFTYELSVLLGRFLDNAYDRAIEYERLLINDELIFDRTDQVTLGKET